jgi:hypothetical protein
MRAFLNSKKTCIAALLAVAWPALAHAGLIANPGFELGLAGWSNADEAGSDGTFFVQSGVMSPVNGDPVPAPTGGVSAAMSDAQGPGSHVLYQTFIANSPMASALLKFDVFVGNRSDAFRTPNTLSFSTPALNQQARVDILVGGADPFSLAAADVLLNAYRTNVGDPLISGYTSHSIDITALVNANLNTPLMLRFAEADNVFTFQFGVDNVDIVPEPATGVIVLTAMLGVVSIRRGRCG